jgi:ActR/RegA family two-component response regulator
MPGGGGLPPTARIAASQPGTAVIVLTMSDDDSVFAALRAGARGYLFKESEGADIARAVHATVAASPWCRRDAGLGPSPGGYEALPRTLTTTPLAGRAGMRRSEMERSCSGTSNSRRASRPARADSNATVICSPGQRWLVRGSPAP